MAYHITEMLILYADKLTVMGNYKNWRALMLQFYSNRENLTLTKYTFYSNYYTTEPHTHFTFSGSTLCVK